MINRRIGRGATAHSTASQWLTPTRNSGSPDAGTVALTQRNIQEGTAASPPPESITADGSTHLLAALDPCVLGKRSRS
ncbi:MAG: hypothetical protein IPO80_04540 [Propionibacteriaceae bacterium]|nr:hypothetical protein [Propionibacteriaceae bacterium]